MAERGEANRPRPRGHGPVRIRGGLRRRLTVAFVLVAGLSAAALAAGSFLLIRTARLQASLERAETEARFNLLLAADTAFGEARPDPEAFVAQYERRGVHALLAVEGRTYASNPSIDLGVPPATRSIVSAGQVGFHRLDVGDTPYLMVGGRPPNSDGELYFLFSEEGLREDLRQLGFVLAAGVLAVVIVAGLVGRALARRTLEPIARASSAARSMAEGFLQARLPEQSKDEFGVWAASFNEMADALETKIRELSEAQARERRFTSDVAHELRTPLTALVAEASLLADQLEQMSPDARRAAELLVRDVGRLRRLVEDLMEISRLDAGMEAVRVEPVELRSTVEGILRSRGWEGRVSVEGDRLPLLTDARRFERVLANLVGNALEHGGNDVAVRLELDDDGARVSVMDHGPGISSEDLPHVFDRFYKADRARSGRGSGLGLAIARDNARLLGGDLEISSEPGLGTKVTLHLPATRPLRPGEAVVAFDAEDEVDTKRKGGPP